MERHDHIEWTRNQLIDEAVRVRESLDTIEHGPARRQDLLNRLGAVALELLCCQIDNQGEDAQTVFAFSDVRWFNEYTPAKGMRLATQSVDFSA
jgi:hypothetical protein